MNWKLTLCLLILIHAAPDVDAVRYREFRIPLPFTLEEYRIGLLWSTAEWSIRNTGGHEGVEVVINEPREGLQYTHKIHHLASKLPRMIRMLAPKGSLEIHEKSWNAFPSVLTNLSNPDYMKDGFHVTTKSRYMEDDDCTQENIFELSDKERSIREVFPLDIANDYVASSDYSPNEDPTKCRSDKLNLGPLTSDWKLTQKPRMCAYKLVEAEFKGFGIQDTAESRILKVCPRLFRNFHRQMFCWADHWAGLSMAEIREIEAYTEFKLDQERIKGSVKGMKEGK